MRCGDSPLAVIYALYAHDGHGPRYVGYTTNPKTRLLRHRRDKGDTHKCRWIRKIGPKNVHMSILSIVPVSVVKEVECFFIAKLRRIGFDLTNSTDGGDGVVCPSVEVRAKSSAASAAHWKDPEYRAKVTAAQKEVWASPGRREAMSSIHTRLWKDAAYREKQTDVLSKAQNRPEVIAKRVADWKNQTFRAKRMEALRRAGKDPIHKANRSLANQGGKNPRSKLTDEQVMDIRGRYMKGSVGRALAAQYNVSPSTISDAARGRTWRHLAGLCPPLPLENL
jgi:hypothetical protein